MLKARTPTPDNLERGVSKESDIEPHDAPNFRELVKLREKSVQANEALRSLTDNLESVKRNETRGSTNFYDDCSPIAEVEEELSDVHSKDLGGPDPGNITIGRIRSSGDLDTSEESKKRIHQRPCLGVLGMTLSGLTGNGSSINAGKLWDSQVSD